MTLLISFTSTLIEEEKQYSSVVVVVFVWYLLLALVVSAGALHYDHQHVELPNSIRLPLQHSGMASLYTHIQT